MLNNEELINPWQESNAGHALAVPGQKSEQMIDVLIFDFTFLLDRIISTEEVLSSF